MIIQIIGLPGSGGTSTLALPTSVSTVGGGGGPGMAGGSGLVIIRYAV